MASSFFRIVPAAVLSVGLFTSSALAATVPCSNGHGVHISPIIFEGIEYELTASCKGTWTIDFDARPTSSFPYIYLEADEAGGKRYCYGDIDSKLGVPDMRRHVVECVFEDPTLKVRMELKQK
jgi:hypothetical protein